MRNVLKITGFLAATALIAVGTFTSCAQSDDDNESNNSTTPALAISGDSISVTVDGSVSETITATLSNETLISTLSASKGDDLTSYISLSDDSFLASGYTIKAAADIASGATTAEFTIAGTAAASAASGTFSVTIAASALTSGAALTSSSTIAYEVTSSSSSTDYFETFASPTGTDWGSTWVAETSTTVAFSSGVNVVCGASADTKFADKTDSTWSDAVACVQLGKKSNDNSLQVPVTGDCTISIYYDSNKVPSTDCRSLFATVSNGTISVSGGTASTTAFYDNTSLTARDKSTVEFTYTGSGETVTFEVCSDSSGSSAAGACYLYGVKVAY